MSMIMFLPLQIKTSSDHILSPYLISASHSAVSFACCFMGKMVLHLGWWPLNNQPHIHLWMLFAFFLICGFFLTFEVSHIGELNTIYKLFFEQKHELFRWKNWSSLKPGGPLQISLGWIRKWWTRKMNSGNQPTNHCLKWRFQIPVILRILMDTEMIGNETMLR